MPTYDYQCNACGHRFELFQSMTAKVKRKCPECGKLQLQRLIGAGAGFLFKGDGFYITDYRSESYKSGEKASKEAKQPKESKESKTTESKPSKSPDGKSSGGGDKKASSKALGSKT